MRTAFGTILAAGAIAATTASAAGGISVENESMAVFFANRGAGFAVTSIVNKISGETRFVGSDCRGPD